VRDGKSSGGYLNHLQSYPTVIHGWFNSNQNLRNTKLVFSFLSGPIPFVFCSRNDHVRLPVGHKGHPGKGTGRGKVCAGSCDLVIV